MTWNIKISANHLSLDIDFLPKNEVLSAFFQQVSPSNYAILISKISNFLTYGSEFSSAIFFKDIDFEDKDYLFFKIGEIKENELWIHQEVFGDTTIEYNLFIKILYDYTHKLLEIYEYDGKIQEEYKFYIKNWIENHQSNEWFKEEMKFYLSLNHNWAEAIKEASKKLAVPMS